MMTEERKPNSSSIIRVDVTFAIKNIRGKDSSFIISGIVREELLGEMTTTIREFMRKYGLAESNFSSYVSSATMPWRDSKGMDQTNTDDS